MSRESDAYAAIIRQAARALGFTTPVQRVQPFGDGYRLYLLGGQIVDWNPIQEPLQEPAAEQDDLTVIVGLGKTYAERLARMGITTFAGLAAADTAVVCQAVKAAPSTVRQWQEDAANA